MGGHTPAPTPSRGVYGFALFLICTCSFGLYTIWAVIPDFVLHSLGITYYPQKYWAIALPVYCLMGLAVFAFFIYPSLNLLLTPSLDSMKTFTDSHASYRNIRGQQNFLNCGRGEEESSVHGIPPAFDIHISENQGNQSEIPISYQDYQKEPGIIGGFMASVVIGPFRLVTKLYPRNC